MSGAITIVGLGSGDENQLSLGAWRTLQNAETLFVRTEHHPVIAWLQGEGVNFLSFDNIYKEKPTFPEVYDAIAEQLLLAAERKEGEIIYAVPGNPMVAEFTVKLLLERSLKRGVDLRFIGGESFLDQAFAKFGFDPIEGFQLLDAGTMTSAHLHPDLHTIIAQVYDTFTASDAKLCLMELYPDDYPIVVGHALGVTGQEQILPIPLYELDRVAGYGNLSLVWVPRSEHEQIHNRLFSRLQDIVRLLRSPQGCPWDRAQTHTSIRKNLLEETNELLETIDKDRPEAMCEELGDVLLQVMLHAQIEAEAGSFDVSDVIEGLNDKLIRRHPHVFGDVTAANETEAMQIWQAMKQAEKQNEKRNRK